MEQGKTLSNVTLLHTLRLSNLAETIGECRIRGFPNDMIVARQEVLSLSEDVEENLPRMDRIRSSVIKSKRLELATGTVMSLVTMIDIFEDWISRGGAPDSRLDELISSELPFVRALLERAVLTAARMNFGACYASVFADDLHFTISVLEHSIPMRELADAWLMEEHPALVGLPMEWIWNAVAEVSA